MNLNKQIYQYNSKKMYLFRVVGLDIFVLSKTVT
jgi:hypothetical protein